MFRVQALEGSKAVNTIALFYGDEPATADQVNQFVNAVNDLVDCFEDGCDEDIERQPKKKGK